MRAGHYHPIDPYTVNDPNNGYPHHFCGGTVNVVSAVVTPRPPLHSNDLEGGVAMAGPERGERFPAATVDSYVFLVSFKWW